MLAPQVRGTGPQGQAQRALQSQVQPPGVHVQAPARQGPAVAQVTWAPGWGRLVGRRGASEELREVVEKDRLRPRARPSASASTPRSLGDGTPRLSTKAEAAGASRGLTLHSAGRGLEAAGRPDSPAGRRLAPRRPSAFTALPPRCLCAHRRPAHSARPSEPRDPAGSSREAAAGGGAAGPRARAHLRAAAARPG